MSELLTEDQWDEVAREWIKREIARTGSIVIEEYSMPPVVAEFARKLVRQQYVETLGGDKMTEFLATGLLAKSRIIDVDISPPNG